MYACVYVRLRIVYTCIHIHVQTRSNQRHIEQAHALAAMIRNHDMIHPILCIHSLPSLPRFTQDTSTDTETDTDTETQIQICRFEQIQICRCVCVCVQIFDPSVYIHGYIYRYVKILLLLQSKASPPFHSPMRWAAGRGECMGVGRR